jgi:hypothetical protein
MARYLYSELARVQHAINTSTHTTNVETFNEAYLRALVDWLPSGSGIDSGTKVDSERTHAERLVLTFGFHHMNEGGYYCGWTEHTAVITPSFRSVFNLRITGRDRNGIKDYLYQTFDLALSRECSVVYWQTLAELHGFDIPRVSVRWVDQSRMVWDVVFPDGTPTLTVDRNASTEQYTDWQAYTHAQVVAWCEANYWEDGRRKVAGAR